MAQHQKLCLIKSSVAYNFGQSFIKLLSSTHSGVEPLVLPFNSTTLYSKCRVV